MTSWGKFMKKLRHSWYFCTEIGILFINHSNSVQPGSNVQYISDLPNFFKCQLTVSLQKKTKKTLQTSLQLA